MHTRSPAARRISYRATFFLRRLRPHQQTHPPHKLVLLVLPITRRAGGAPPPLVAVRTYAVNSDAISSGRHDTVRGMARGTRVPTP